MLAGSYGHGLFKSRMAEPIGTASSWMSPIASQAQFTSELNLPNCSEAAIRARRGSLPYSTRSGVLVCELPLKASGSTTESNRYFATVVALLNPAARRVSIADAVGAR